MKKIWIILLLLFAILSGCSNITNSENDSNSTTTQSLGISLTDFNISAEITTEQLEKIDLLFSDQFIRSSGEEIDEAYYDNIQKIAPNEEFQKFTADDVVDENISYFEMFGFNGEFGVSVYKYNEGNVAFLYSLAKDERPCLGYLFYDTAIDSKYLKSCKNVSEICSIEKIYNSDTLAYFCDSAYTICNRLGEYMWEDEKRDYFFTVHLTDDGVYAVSFEKHRNGVSTNAQIYNIYKMNNPILSSLSKLLLSYDKAS